MPTPQLTIPRPAAPVRLREPRPGVPKAQAERQRLMRWVRHYVAEFKPVPPLPFRQIKEHADRVVEALRCDPVYRDYIGVLIGNETWREALASVPYERRLLLLPKCLRSERKCPATFDEFGLLCKQCGLCSIADLQAEAENLGYAVLVAEGSAVVMSLIQTHQVEAIIGVSCMNVLERAFPFMEAAAIPGVAIPLLQDDCIETTVDLDWVRDYIHLSSEDRTRRLDLGRLRAEVESWFEPASLEQIMGAPDGDAETVARKWLARGGKRWRPFLAVAVFEALRKDCGAVLPEDLKKIAVAVECFHKASLIHDDIEDDDAERYGEKTLHQEHGLAVALNAGDLLIGEGYRLIATCSVSAEQRTAMMLVAAEGQRQLCQGQGQELAWAQKPGPLTKLQVLDIFRLKTAPAFEVALQLGALYAGCEAHEPVAGALSAYSDALGIAYQIRDDLEDFAADSGITGDASRLRPSLLLALALERARLPEARQILEKLWLRQVPEHATASEIRALATDLKAESRARLLLETFKEEAVRSLRELESANLKGLLRRIVGKIFVEPEVESWCSEVGKG
ncbi:MAG: polyprenyl synthetase family protein [Verrucomicrobiota bacterium]